MFYKFIRMLRKHRLLEAHPVLILKHFNKKSDDISPLNSFKHILYIIKYRLTG